MATHRKNAAALTFAGIFALAGAAAFAQPTFSIPTDVVAAPGTTVEIPVRLTGGVADTAAVNLTLRVSNAQSGLINGAISANQGTLPNNFLFQDNNLTAPDGGKEYRMVLYSQSNPPATFDSTGNSQVVMLRVPIAANAAPGSVININIPSGNDGFETRNGAKIGLLGVSDADGDSIVADSNGDSALNPDLDRPLGTAGQITVGFSGFPTALDFQPSGGANNWIYNQFVPFRGNPGVEIVGTPSAGNGFQINLAQTAGVDDTPARVYFGQFTFDFGFLTRTEGFVNPPVDTIVRARYTVGSNGANRFDVPILRPRMAAADNSISVEAVFQGPNIGNVVNPTVPTTGNDKVIQVMSYVPAIVKDGNASDVGNPDGFNVPFEAYHTSGIGTAGTSVFVRGLVVDVLSPGSLGNATAVYTRDFTTQGGGEFSQFALNPAPGAIAVDYTTDSNGLGIRPTSAPQNEGTQLSFGFFDTGANSLFTIDSSRIYRLTWTVGTTSGARNTVPTHRVRFLVADTFDYATSVVTSAITESKHAPVSGTDSTYTAYISFPAEVSGRNVITAFDVYRDSASLGNEFLYLRNLTIESFQP